MLFEHIAINPQTTELNVNHQNSMKHSSVDLYPKNQTLKLTKGVMIAAIYFIVHGTLGIIWPFTGLGPFYQEFVTQQLDYKIYWYAKEHLVNILFLVSGIGLLNKKYWARKIALIILVISAFIISKGLAWGYAGGRPTKEIYIVSIIIVCSWNSIWFYLIKSCKHPEFK